MCSSLGPSKIIELLTFGCLNSDGFKLVWLFLLLRFELANSFIRVNRCYSCMSSGYEDLFKEGHLSKYFFEPKNFTSQCDYPMDTTDVGFVPCRTICLTLIQDLMVMGRPTGKKLTMRGCSTSLNRFGFENKTMNIFDRYDMCREVKMTDLFNYETDSQLVTVCSCLGDRCNGLMNTSQRPGQQLWQLIVVYTFIIFIHII